MKRVEYFNTKEELERYYENGVPSTVLAVVQADASEPAVLYTSSNNSPVDGGSTEQQGGMIPPAGYILPEGTYDITANGLADISTYEMVNVDVPIPAGYIVPKGSYSYKIPATGQNDFNYDVHTYAYAYISILWGKDYYDSLTYANYIINGIINVDE